MAYNVGTKHCKQNKEFQYAKKCSGSVTLINESANRWIKLIQEFNSSITKNKEGMQHPLQGVLDSRRNF
jgi:hypothetical protein